MTHYTVSVNQLTVKTIAFWKSQSLVYVKDISNDSHSMQESSFCNLKYDQKEIYDVKKPPTVATS